MSARAPINAPSTNIKSLLENQVFSLYYCLDSEQLAEQYPPLNNSQDYYYKLQMCSSVKEALDSLINGYLIALNVYNDNGSVGVGNNPQYVGGSLTLRLPLDFHNSLHHSPLRLIFLSNFKIFLVIVCHCVV